MAEVKDFESALEQKVRKVRVVVEFNIDSESDEDARETAARAIDVLMYPAEGDDNYVETHDKVIEQLKPVASFTSLEVGE